MTYFAMQVREIVVYGTKPSPWGEGGAKRRMRGKEKKDTPHQSKIKDFCQLLPREKLWRPSGARREQVPALL
jgi:hypothetical protein